MSHLDVDGVAIHYDDSGAGDLVVMVHGAVASSRQFDGVAPHLERYFRVVRPDLRGMGQSDRTAPVEPRSWAEDIAGLIRHLDDGPVHLVGSSLGARVALRVALDGPDLVRTLTLDAAIVKNEPDGDAALDGLFGADMPEDFALAVESWQGDGWEAVVDRYRAIRADRALQEHYSTVARLRELSMPVLVTRGDADDQAHPIAHSAAIHRAAKTSWMWIAPGTGFSALRFEPEAFATLFARFVREH